MEDGNIIDNQAITEVHNAGEEGRNNLLEQETSVPCSRRRGRGRNRGTSTNEIEIDPTPRVLEVNQYVVSPQNALDLMAKICSAEPSAKNIEWKNEIGKILDDFNFTDLVKDNRPLLLNPTFDKDLSDTVDRLVFAMENEFFGNRPRVRIAVAGLFTAGKSALLNHLVQQPNLLPEDPNPSTVVPAYLYCRKDIEENHIFGVNQNQALIQLDEPAINGIEHKNKPGEEEGAIQKGASEQIATALHHFIVEIPHEDFDKMVFIDTPGFGNKGSRDSRIAQDCIDRADMLVYLADCTNGSLKDEELRIIDRFSINNKGPILVMITRNDLPSRESAENTFNLITSQLSSNSFVKDVICLSVRNSDNYWSRSGLSLVDSLQTTAKNAKCTTDIDIYWQTIKDLFDAEKLYLSKQMTSLQASRIDVINAKIELEKATNHRLEIIPDNVENALRTNSVFRDDDTLCRLRTLTEYYKHNSHEDIRRHQRIIDVFDKKIKESSDLQVTLKKILEKLDWWKSDTIKQLFSIKYTKVHSKSSYSAFDAVEDISDVNLDKLIMSLSGGYDVTTKYNAEGFSVLTYAAYCGNIQSLIFIISRINERYVFMRDQKKRNIMHAAAEGLQLNTLEYLKQKYPNYISQKDLQDKTCDDIFLEQLKSRLYNYED